MASQVVTAAPPRRARVQARAEEVLETVPAAMDALRGAMRRHVGDQLSVPQFRCLNFVAKTPACSIGAVAEFLGVTMPTASAMVDRLVRAGAVAPRTASEDRRRSQLHITRAGQAQLRQIQSGARDELSTLLARQSDEELETLRAGLAVLHRALRQD